MKNIGGLWINTSKKTNKKYLEIKPELLDNLKQVKTETEKVFIFPNQKRPDKKDPDYSVMVVEKTTQGKPKAPPVAQDDDFGF